MKTITPEKKHRGKSKEKEVASRQSKRICLPNTQEDFEAMVEDKEVFKAYLDQSIRDYPELYPKGIEGGYKLYGFVEDSKKMPEVRIRRICLHERDEQGKEQVFQVLPCDVLPYMTGYVGEVEKPLFLHEKYGVPVWALSYVFGKDDMYWYRVSLQLGRNDIVGTTIKDPTKLPGHLLGDEKHARFNGDKLYIATTVAEECVLGASVSLSASEAGLTEAYGVFSARSR